MTEDLFDTVAEPATPWVEPLEAGAMVLRQFARRYEAALLEVVRQVIEESPLRHMVTPGGFRMSVAMTNCGELGWVTDRTGYRYDAFDPETGRRWPRMPVLFSRLASEAASQAGFDRFVPDACLVNRYEAGTRLSLHQDRDERDHSQPIVSVSLGLPAVFLFGGAKRTDKARRIPLAHGDVVVWGGPARLHHHGVLPLKEGAHPFMGDCRINLTFRKAA